MESIFHVASAKCGAVSWCRSPSSNSTSRRGKVLEGGGVEVKSVRRTSMIRHCSFPSTSRRKVLGEPSPNRSERRCLINERYYGQCCDKTGSQEGRMDATESERISSWFLTCARSPAPQTGVRPGASPFRQKETRRHHCFRCGHADAPARHVPRKRNKPSNLVTGSPC